MPYKPARRRNNPVTSIRFFHALKLVLQCYKQPIDIPQKLDYTWVVINQKLRESHLKMEWVDLPESFKNNPELMKELRDFIFTCGSKQPESKNE